MYHTDFYLTKRPITAVMMIKTGKTKISTVFKNPIKNIWIRNEFQTIKNRFRTLQSNQNMDF